MMLVVKLVLISVLAAAPVLIAAFVWERRRNAASARLRAAVTANTAAAERLVAAVGQVGEAAVGIRAGVAVRRP